MPDRCVMDSGPLRGGAGAPARDEQGRLALREAALRRRCVRTSKSRLLVGRQAQGRADLLSALRHQRRARARIIRVLWRAHEALEPRHLARLLRDHGCTRWLSRQVDALLRRGDRWAAEVERVCEAELGPLMQGPTNPASGWRGATGRLRGIAPGPAGLRARRDELETEARAAGHDSPISLVRRGRRFTARTGLAPDHHYLHGAIASAVVALWDLGVVRSRLRTGWPARRALTSLSGLARGRS